MIQYFNQFKIKESVSKESLGNEYKIPDYVAAQPMVGSLAMHKLRRKSMHSKGLLIGPPYQ
jgi:hypothetical protein